MNKSERQNLSLIAANRKYGRCADRQSATFADELLNTFPAIKGEFEYFAQMIASERIAGVMIDVLVGSIFAKEAEDRFTSLNKNVEALGDAFDAWCYQTGRSAAKMVDDSEEIKDLIIDPSFKAHMREAALDDERLVEFVELIG